MRIKKKSFGLQVVQLLTLFFLVFMLWRPVYSKTNPNSPTLKIALFGDSLVAGYGLDDKNNLTTRLQEIFDLADPKLQFINYGISGDTTSSARTRVSWLIDEIKPDIVFLAIGANDMLRGINPNLVRVNIESIIKELKSAEIKVILMRVLALANLGENYQKQFNQIYPNLARQYQISLYPFLLNSTFNQKELMQKDGLHPSKDGIKIIAQELSSFLQDWLTKTEIKN